MRSPMRASSVSMSGADCADELADRPAAARNAIALRAHISSILVLCRIVDAHLEKRVMPLAALAAEAAVRSGFGFRESGLESRFVTIPGARWIHARQGVLERHAKRDAASDDIGFARPGVRRVNLERVREAARLRLSDRRAGLRRC